MIELFYHRTIAVQQFELPYPATHHSSRPIVELMAPHVGRDPNVVRGYQSLDIEILFSINLWEQTPRL